MPIRTSHIRGQRRSCYVRSHRTFYALLLPHTYNFRLKSFVFYAYTGGITFARLKSQGSRVSGHTESPSVPICSPKSMYRLADLVRDLTQRDMAVADNF